ncbi:MAG: prephenate dehydratase [Flavobacteriales bacterium CG_4_9_14_3_um_filter_40_17]|nr:MAG: prephenate dehydratase [Flavobacteriales bacterium CG_4_9_14_3_um_filter_40_17]
MQKAIAIQGILGSFHHKVAQRYFDENVRVKECMSFGELVKSMLSGECDLGVMAIENSIAGSIIPNYALIDENNLKIIGEYFLPIHHNLMVLPGQSLREVKEVWSHPMALLQCRVFFDKNPQIKLVEDKDTAEVARRISQEKIEGVAAVASRKAAELYGLEIVAPEIQTINNNSTRFVILNTAGKQKLNENINKASLKFILNHDRGSLATVLNVMNDCGLNLTKIQSLPIINLPWKYSFFADVTFSDEKHYRKAVSLLEIMASELTILGEYNTHEL